MLTLAMERISFVLLRTNEYVAATYNVCSHCESPMFLLHMLRWLLLLLFRVPRFASDLMFLFNSSAAITTVEALWFLVCLKWRMVRLTMEIMDTTTTNMNVLCRRVPLVRSLTHSWLAHSMRHMRDHWARTNARLANILHPLRHLELGITAPLSQWPAAQHKRLECQCECVCVFCEVVLVENSAPSSQPGNFPECLHCWAPLCMCAFMWFGFFLHLLLPSAVDTQKSIFDNRTYVNMYVYECSYLVRVP